MHLSRALVILSLVVSHMLLGQTLPAIKGKVINEQRNPIDYASVVLLKQNDSTFINYTITDSKGEFTISEVPKDSLIIQFSYLGYLTLFKKIHYKNNPIDLGEIILKEELYELGAVEISVEAPIQIKEDTIAYSASSFKVHPSDNIETLLKKLPGLEIESDGKVIAQGNEVTKIFVDGKEFFGGDPAIVLKNLSADAIAKIEVIDKKSDEAELTGVDDGNKQMVINLTLKKSNKNQGFGKASTGMGLDSRYFGNINYNRFSSTTQLAVIGKYNNINITGSNIQGFLENVNGIADESDEETNSSTKAKSLSGYLKTGVTGINIGHEFKEKESFNADYFYNLSDNNGTSTSKRISFTNTNNFDYEADNIFDKKSQNHNLNFNYQNKSNRNNSLTIKGLLTSDEIIQNTTLNGVYYSENGDLDTKNSQTYINNNTKNSLNLNINFYQKLKKLGRSFSSGFNTTINSQKKGNEQTTFVTKNITSGNLSERKIFTLRDETFKNGLYNFNFKYTEPLGGDHYFKFQSFLKVLNQKEDIYQFKTTISNNNAEEILAYEYINKEGSYQNRLAYNYSTKRLNIFSGVELQELKRSYGVITEDSFDKSQFYLNPISTIQYKPSKGEKYRLNYRRIIRSPRTFESSTVVNDLNPYFIKKGNPNLKTEKKDDYTLTANIYNHKSSINFNGKIQYQFSKDAIVQNIDIDDDFVKTRSYINSGNRTQFLASFNFSKKIKGLGVRYAIKNRNFYNTSNSIINLQLNDVASKDFLIGFLLENTNKNRLDLKFGANYSFNNTSFSIEQDLNRIYRKQQYFSALDYNITDELNFNTQFDYFLFSDDQFATNLHLPIWNMAVSYNISKNNHMLKLVLIDLLDKNVDFERRSTANYFEETTSESLGRYVILSYTYRLGSGKKEKTS